MTTKADILAAVRAKCLDCCCGQPGEVRACTIVACTLWPFRLGRDPEPSRSRGFAKSSVYTGDSSVDDPGRHPDSTLPSTHRKSLVYTGDFAEEGALP